MSEKHVGEVEAVVVMLGDFNAVWMFGCRHVLTHLSSVRLQTSLPLVVFSINYRLINIVVNENKITCFDWQNKSYFSCVIFVMLLFSQNLSFIPYTVSLM